MGFWDSMAKAGKYVLEETKKKAEEINEKASEFECYSDDELLRMRKSGTLTTKAAATKVLKNRGYSFDDWLQYPKHVFCVLGAFFMKM